MEIAQSKNTLRLISPQSWLQAAALLAPLWMMALAVTVEGFPSPPISIQLALLLFLAAIPAAIWAVMKHRAGFEILLVSLVPLSFVVIFDEITTAYKTPFIFFCTLILSLGVLAYRYFHDNRYLQFALPVLLAVAVLAVLAANYAASNFWAYASSLDIGECFIDFPGCPPLPAGSPAWWRFFLLG